MLHLPVKKRDTKIKAKNIIKENFIPGVVYGPKMKSTPLSVERGDFLRVYREAGETTLIALDVEGEKESKEDNVVLIRDTQSNPVTGRFMHVDFYQLPMDQEIEITVPVRASGEAPAVKEAGGVLVHNLHEVDIKALPKDLIHEITVDITGLDEIGKSILVNELKTSDKVEVLAEDDEVVFMVDEPREEEPEEEEVELTEEDQIADIKTEGEEKREAEEDEEGEEGEEGGEEKTPQE
ncbi:MAG: 50S ribosomal protein L25 [Candidatus Spechtbacterales bacterium]|nr:50S ribosomal protein L25 [Candidatus Spechtbacterales bacterium]